MTTLDRQARAGDVTVATIRLAALEANVRAIRGRLAKGTGICGVVKADAYGHGLVPCAKALVGAGVDRLAIAATDEAAQLRRAGISLPILRVVPAPQEDLERALACDVEEQICSINQAEFAAARATAAGKTLGIHIEVDSGMGRSGILPGDAVEAVAHICALPGLRLAGLMTHFPDADSPDNRVLQQARQLQEIARALRGRGIRVPAVHMANSTASLWYPETHGDFVRPGLALYGITPCAWREDQPALQPVMSVQSRVVDLRTLPAGHTVGYCRTHTLEQPAPVATVGLGYSDGLPRSASNRAQLLLHGRRVPVIGIVSMNLITVDATDCPRVQLGDPVTVLGTEDGAAVTARDLAEWCETIPYEITCRFGVLPHRFL